MKKGIHVSAYLAVILALGQVADSQAALIDTESVDYNGAQLTIEGQWIDASVYQLTYSANFDGLESPGDDLFLAAFDWKWEGAHVNTISLKAAPTDLSDWTTHPYYQLDFGEDVGCAQGGGQGSVCTEYTGTGAGLSLTGDLSWVFEVTFKHARQSDRLRTHGARVGYGGGFAAPLGIVALSAPLAEEPSGQVPVPGVLPLMVIGLAGMVAGFRRR